MPSTPVWERVAGLVKLQGTIKAAEFGLDTANTAKTGLKVHGAVATGGAPLLLEGLASRLILQGCTDDEDKQHSQLKKQTEEPAAVLIVDPSPRDG